MISRSTLQHLRIPFSIFLMPVFLMAAMCYPYFEGVDFIISFVALHLFLYPASNGFNSYFDKDEGSIGGVKKPLPVNKELYYISLLFDGIAIMIGLIIGVEFAIMILIYGLVSKAYSHPVLRLKKYPWLSWVVLIVFQGAFTFFMSLTALKGFDPELLFSDKSLFAACGSSLMLAGFYPLTQIYQHKEDAKRGDLSLSRILGIKGTMLFSSVFFGIGAVFYTYFFWSFFQQVPWLFYLFAIPVGAYFAYWTIAVFIDENKADFQHTMWMNILASLSLCLLFTSILLFERFN